MKKYSLTYIGLIILIISIIAHELGINVVEGDIETTIITIGKFIGAILAFIGRYRKGGINVLGLKK